jgi:DNA repair/transcription protein MET18/MMS19
MSKSQISFGYNNACFCLLDEDLSVLLSDLLATLMDAVDRDDALVTQATNAVSLLSWLTKALVMRGHRQADTWIDKLVGMLSHGTVGTMVAEGFKLIMAQNEEYLNFDNYCNVRSVFLHVSLHSLH